MGYLDKIFEDKNLMESAKKYLKITQEDFAMLTKISHKDAKLILFSFGFARLAKISQKGSEIVEY